MPEGMLLTNEAMRTFTRAEDRNSVSVVNISVGGFA